MYRGSRVGGCTEGQGLGGVMVAWSNCTVLFVCDYLLIGPV